MQNKNKKVLTRIFTPNLLDPNHMKVHLRFIISIICTDITEEMIKLVIVIESTVLNSMELIITQEMCEQNEYWKQAQTFWGLHCALL